MSEIETFDGYYGSSLLDAYIMNSLEEQHDNLHFLINSRYAGLNYKYVISWEMKDDATLQEENTFKLELLNSIKNGNNRYILAHISFISVNGVNHRNALFIDIKNSIFILFDNGLCNTQDYDLMYVEKRKKMNMYLIHTLMHIYFKKLVEDVLNKKLNDSGELATSLLDPTILNFAPKLINLINTEKELIKFEKIFIESSCTLFCYVFTSWIVDQKDKTVDVNCNFNVANIKKIITEIHVKTKCSLVDLKDTPKNIHKLRNLLDPNINYFKENNL